MFVRYSSYMENRKWSLLQQRVHYFTKGNFHGVSGNWLSKQCDSIFPDILSFANSPDCPVNLLARDLIEGRAVFESVVAEKSGENFGKNFDCEAGLASFLYAHILSARPSLVIETGVANGITTNVIMRALEATGGSLHSFDVDPRTENVYRGKGSWIFHLLKGNFEQDLVNQVARFGEVDLWIHDSNHGYQWQAFEYNLAASKLHSGGLLVSDDIDASTAWGMTSKSNFKKSFAIFDIRKFFGVATI